MFGASFIVDVRALRTLITNAWRLLSSLEKSTLSDGKWSKSAACLVVSRTSLTFISLELYASDVMAVHRLTRGHAWIYMGAISPHSSFNSHMIIAGCSHADRSPHHTLDEWHIHFTACVSRSLSFLLFSYMINLAASKRLIDVLTHSIHRSGRLLSLAIAVALSSLFRCLDNSTSASCYSKFKICSLIMTDNVFIFS